MASEFIITHATRKRLVLSETDLNKSSTLMHDRDKRSAQAEPDRLHYLGHTSVSILFGSWLDQRTLQGMYWGDFTFEKPRHKRNPAKDRQVLPERQTWWFCILLRIAKLQINKLDCRTRTTRLFSDYFWGETRKRGLPASLPSLITAIPNPSSQQAVIHSYYTGFAPALTWLWRIVDNFGYGMLVASWGHKIHKPTVRSFCHYTLRLQKPIVCFDLGFLTNVVTTWAWASFTKADMDFVMPVKFSSSANLRRPTDKSRVGFLE
jgi:hypothetical protein